MSTETMTQAELLDLLDSNPAAGILAVADWVEQDVDGWHHAQIDRGHRDNLGGKHRDGFCEACADAHQVLQDRVARARGNIYTGLSGWARIVAAERGFALPEDDVHSISRYLLGRNGGQLDWLCAQPWVDELVDLTDVLHREAFALLYPRGRRRFEVGDCIEVTSCDVDTRAEQRCPGRMVATLTNPDDDFPPTIWCSDCGYEVAGNQWINYGQRVHKAMGVSA